MSAGPRTPDVDVATHLRNPSQRPCYGSRCKSHLSKGGHPSRHALQGPENKTKQTFKEDKETRVADEASIDLNQWVVVHDDLLW